MHTGLGFPFSSQFHYLTPEKLDNFRRLFSDLGVCIIDEISMVSSDRTYDVHKRFCEIFISQELFASKCMLFIGDLMQLKPVQARRVFDEPKSLQNKALFYSDDNIWQNFESVILKTNHRQGECIWTECLNRIRVGELLEEDINLLETRRVKHFPQRNFSEACHVFGTNEEVEQTNLNKLNELTGPLLELEAVIECPRGYKPKITKYGTIQDTGFMKKLKVKNGAKVFLTSNINIADSLVNGMIGQIVEILYCQPRKGLKTMVKAIVVKFDRHEVGQETSLKYQHLSNHIKHGGVPIFFHQLVYNIPGKNPNSKHGSKCVVTQIPLRLAYAFTAHRLQGKH